VLGSRLPSCVQLLLLHPVRCGLCCHASRSQENDICEWLLTTANKKWVDKTLLDNQQQQRFPGARTVLLAPAAPYPPLHAASLEVEVAERSCTGHVSVPVRGLVLSTLTPTPGRLPGPSGATLLPFTVPLNCLWRAVKGCWVCRSSEARYGCLHLCSGSLEGGQTNNKS
jgi:hypothetical protein